MKLMALPPESQRLRRIAKAHAAGEFSKDEYRQARRVLLEELARAGTSPLEETFRRRADTARRVDQNAETVRVTLRETSSPRRRGTGFGWFVGALGVLIAVMGAFAHLG